MRNARLIPVVLAVLTIAVAGRTCTGQAVAALHPSNPGDPPTLAIGPGDMLEITVFDVPELNLKVRVGDDGNVSLPLVGTMYWKGQSVMQAQQMLAQKLVDGEYVNAPQVSVFIADYATQGVSVTGQVNQPGIYPLLGPHTLFDAISAAGGVTPNAGASLTITHKNDPDHPEKVAIGSNGALESPSHPIQPGDMIFVVETGVVYVVGEVNHPGGFVMGNNSQITASKAVALAFGPTTRGQIKRVSILRHTASGMLIYTLNLKKVLQATEPDLVLQADDIVYVPNSGVRTASDILQKASIGAAAAAVIHF